MKKQNPSFENALKAASLWCDAWDKDEISDEVLSDRISELLETKTGARAFFVISLASETVLMDRTPESLILKLRNAGEPIVELIVRNLAMSTAMSLHHKRNNSPQMQATSEKIKRRCIELLRTLEPTSVKKQLELLLNATKGKGPYIEFLDRWNYDNAQKDYIAESIYSVAETKKG